MANYISLEHPGVILQEEFIEPLELTAYRVSQGTGIPQTALGQIIKGQRSISNANSLKLARYFGLSDEYFANLQLQYDLDVQKRKDSAKLKKIIPLFPKSKTPPEDEELLEA